MDDVRVGERYRLPRDLDERFFTVIGFSVDGQSIHLLDTLTKESGEPWKHSVTFDWFSRYLERDDTLPYSHRS